MTSDCSAMPTLKKRSGYLARKSAVSVYLPRSAVSSTMSLRVSAALSRPMEKGAFTEGRPTISSDSLMASVRDLSIFGLQFACHVIPFVCVDPHEVRTIALFNSLDAGARTRAHHDHLGAPLALRRPLEGVQQLVQIIAVNFPRQPAEGFETLVDGVDGDHQRAVRLNAIAVDPADQVLQTEGRCRVGGLPGGTFLQLTVTDFYVDGGLPAVQAVTRRQPGRHAQAMAQRTPGHFHAG